MNKKVDDDTVNKLKQVFKENNWVKLAFLFGSQSKGIGKVESDFDVAIWPDENSTEREKNQLWLQLEKALKKPVDLVSVPDASPLVAWEAFSGIPLVIRDQRFYINKMLEVSDEAHDFSSFVMDIWKAREKDKR